MLQGKNAASQKWSFIREQKPDEVLFIQFFDSHADKEGRFWERRMGAQCLLEAKRRS
jgi:hypothetical protein